jgi:hypothetical protein
MNQKIIKLSRILFKLGLNKEASDLEAINGPAGKTEFSGILKLMPTTPPTDLQSLLSDYFGENGLSPLPADKLHITLLNQTILKPYAKELKGKPIPQYEGSLTYKDIYSVVREDEGKHSVFVVLEEQSELAGYVSEVLSSLGISAEPESNRIYHISLGNKTGSPFDSVGHSEEKPIRLEDCTKII